MTRGRYLLISVCALGLAGCAGGAASGMLGMFVALVMSGALLAPVRASLALRLRRRDTPGGQAPRMAHQSPARTRWCTEALMRAQ